MLTLYQLDQTLRFPAAESALDEPSGLLAFGGDLSVKRLLLAYSQGIFPWFSEGEPILWWSPQPRGILPLEQFICSQSLQKFIRKHTYKITINHAFDQVILACAKIPRNDSGTWITPQMINAYQDLHQAGHAQSIEVWEHDQLLGGLYGVTVGRVFCGESMFHRASNTSKLAMYYLIEHLKANGGAFIDCQLQNPHLASLGCVSVERLDFLDRLARATVDNFEPAVWQPKILVI
ncbi:MAG: leucyl/phenylalanyl-tRNA--protein transferase [Paraglaciecola sp.]|jgi:leucyl/phenylalanyl-tRNA--protein transferase